LTVYSAARQLFAAQFSSLASATGNRRPLSLQNPNRFHEERARSPMTLPNSPAASRRGLIAATSQTINGRRIVVRKDIYLHRFMFLRRKEHK
jgi:hypothetical protein